MLSYFVSLICRGLCLIILLVVLLSWVPLFDVKKEPVATLVKIYKYIMAPFKAIIPPIGMFDISPIVAFIAIRFIEASLLNILANFGL